MKKNNNLKYSIQTYNNNITDTFLMKRFFLPLLILFTLIPIYNQAQDLSGPVPIIRNPAVTDPDGYFAPFTYNAGVQETEIGCGVTSVDAIAGFTDVGTTSDYIVESIPYKPVRFGFQPSLPGQQIYPNQDDKFFDVYDLGDLIFVFMIIHIINIS